MKYRGLLIAAMAASSLSSCSAPVKARDVEAKRSPPLPPHAVEVAYGLFSCERGYLLRKRQCVSEDEVSHEPQFEMFGGPPPVPDEEAPPLKPEDRLKANPSFEWNEADFPPRPVAAHAFSLAGESLSTVIGTPTSYALPPGQSLYEAARHLGLGINQVAEAFPDLDLVRPPAGLTLDFPTWWILPDSDYKGLVINVPEMRVYYFPSQGTVITYPVGLGRDDWQTPIARFRVVEKTTDPPWLIPETIRAEHIRDRGDARTMIAGGDPDNPLGHFRLRLSLPLYGIHGTNIPWGIGMQVTHGCVRLYPEDIERLFAMVPISTPGQFVYQPVKVGARDGEVYIEVHSDVYATRFDYLHEAIRVLAARGWSRFVDWDLLNQAIEEKRATPTRVSDGSSPLRRNVGPVEARSERAPPS